MISDQNQCGPSFIGQRENLQLHLWLLREQSSSSLKLELTLVQTMQKFILILDTAYLEQHPQMSFCFDTPEDVFYTIMELFDTLIISPDGTILLSMQLNSSTLKKKTFELRLEKQAIETHQKTQWQLQKFMEEFKFKLGDRDQRIISLNKKIVAQNEQIKHQNQQIRVLKSEQQQLFLENKRQQLKINGLAKQNQLQRQQLVGLKKTLHDFQQGLSMLQFYSYHDNPHWHHFAVSNLGPWARIVKKDGQGQWHSFILNSPIPTSKYSRYAIRKQKSQNGNVMVGVASRQAFGKISAYKSEQSVAYDCYSGNVWVNGDTIKGGCFVKEGEIVWVQVNLNAMKISWHLNSSKKVQVEIPEILKNKEMFLVIQQYNCEDEVQLLFQ